MVANLSADIHAPTGRSRFKTLLHASTRKVRIIGFENQVHSISQTVWDEGAHFPFRWDMCGVYKGSLQPKIHQYNQSRDI